MDEKEGKNLPFLCRRYSSLLQPASKYGTDFDQAPGGFQPLLDKKTHMRRTDGLVMPVLLATNFQMSYCNLGT